MSAQRESKQRESGTEKILNRFFPKWWLSAGAGEDLPRMALLGRMAAVPARLGGLAKRTENWCRGQDTLFEAR